MSAPRTPPDPRPVLTPSPWQPARPAPGSTWLDFTEWVVWLDHAYELDLPECWIRHEGLVHTVAGLWHLWRSSYAETASGGMPGPGGPAVWHTQFFYPFRDRLFNGSLPGAQCRMKPRHQAYSRALMNGEPSNLHTAPGPPPGASLRRGVPCRRSRGLPTSTAWARPRACRARRGVVPRGPLHPPEPTTLSLTSRAQNRPTHLANLLVREDTGGARPGCNRNAPRKGHQPFRDRISSAVAEMTSAVVSSHGRRSLGFCFL